MAAGRIGRPHGVRGEVRVDPMGGLPRGLDGYTRFYLGRRDDVRPVEVEAHRRHGRYLRVKFAGVDTPEAARLLSGQTLFLEREEMPPLAEDEYYHADLLDCRVVGEGGEDLGRVVDVMTTGETDVLVVARAGREWMLPVVSAFVASLDPERGEIATRDTEGLRE